MKITEMTTEERIKYYVENYGVTEEQARQICAEAKEELKNFLNPEQEEDPKNNK